MRASRVSATTSSIFRHEQQYLHAGDISHNFSQNQQQPFKKNMQNNKGKKQDAVKPKKQQALGNLTQAYVDSDHDLQVRHELIETATKLNRISKQQKRLTSYSSSI